MTTKYVIELTKAQLSMLKQAMETHFLEIDTLGYSNSEKACFDRTDKILMNSKTKAEYLEKQLNEKSYR